MRVCVCEREDMKGLTLGAGGLLFKGTLDFRLERRRRGQAEEEPLGSSAAADSACPRAGSEDPRRPRRPRDEGDVQSRAKLSAWPGRRGRPCVWTRPSEWRGRRRGRVASGEA